MKLQKPSIKDYLEAPRHDENAMLRKFVYFPEKYMCTPKSMRTDEFILKAIEKNYRVFLYLTKGQQRDQELIDACVRSSRGYSSPESLGLTVAQYYSPSNFEHYYKQQIDHGMMTIEGDALGPYIVKSRYAKFVEEALQKSSEIRSLNASIANKVIRENAEKICDQIARQISGGSTYKTLDEMNTKYWLDQINQYCPGIIPMLEKAIKEKCDVGIERHDQETNGTHQSTIKTSDEMDHEEEKQIVNNSESTMTVGEMVEIIESNWDVFVSAIESGEISEDSIRSILGVDEKAIDISENHDQDEIERT